MQEMRVLGYLCFTVPISKKWRKNIIIYTFILLFCNFYVFTITLL